MTEIISRSEAKAKGLKRYFTGEPCKRGHIAERLISDCTCVQCYVAARIANTEKIREQRRIRYAANPEKMREQKRAQLTANRGTTRQRNRARRMANPEKFRERDRTRRMA